MTKTTLFIVISFVLINCTSEITLTEEEKTQVISELNQIKILDQQYAGIPPASLKEKYGNKKAWEIFKTQRDSIGLLNQQKIKGLYKQYGYLGEKKLGKVASSDFWISIQHADNDVIFQQEMLAALKKEIEKGSNDKLHYAMLEDRININLKKPQRFGSQVIYNENGQAIPKFGLVDSTIVDSLRKEYTLPTLKEYYNDMTTMHYEMNKQMFIEKNIREPQLYK